MIFKKKSVVTGHRKNAFSLSRIQEDNTMKIKVAFVCVHNSCRSQIAEALAKKVKSQNY